MKRLLALLLCAAAIGCEAGNLLIDSRGESVIIPKKEAIAEVVKESIELRIPAGSFCTGAFPLDNSWKTLSISMEMKATGLVPGSRPWEKGAFGVSFRNREGKSVGKPLILSTAGTSEWTKIERDLEIPEGAVRLLLDPVNFSTAGTFEIRGLTFSAR